MLSNTEDSDIDDEASKGDKVDDFFSLIKKLGKSCKSFMLWWKYTGMHRFPKTTHLVRDIHMAIGSS